MFLLLFGYYIFKCHSSYHNMSVRNPEKHIEQVNKNNRMISAGLVPAHRKRLANVMVFSRHVIFLHKVSRLQDPV